MRPFGSLRPSLALLALGLAALGHAQTPKAARIPVIAVTPLESKGVEANEAGVIADNLAVQLQQSGKFRVMERSQMQQILKEQNFQQSGACDGSQCAVEMGKLLGIDRMVVGSVGRIGSTYSLSLRLVDVSTGEAMRTSARNTKGKIDDVLSDLLPVAVADLTKGLSSNSAVAGTAKTPSSSSSEPTEGSKIRIWPWVVGGVVLAGGGAAALLLTGSSSKSTPAAPTTDPTTDPGTGSTATLPVSFTW